MRCASLAVLGFLFAGFHATAATFELEARIPLPDCKGRIDHLALDPDHQRLFIAELGNNSVAVVDLGKQRFERRLEGFDEPQGIAYFAPLQRLYVASGGDGSVRAYDATDFKPVGGVRLSGDADNLRIDPVEKRLYVGFGNGALAALDLHSLGLKGMVVLKTHPESFQLSPVDGRIFVNLPDAREIAVVDRATLHQVVSWPVGKWAANYPMAIDASASSVIAVFRNPHRIVRYSMTSGFVSADAEVCGDADDMFVDAKRNRLYVICGSGAIDILDRETLRHIDRFPTSPGARTGLYSAEADTLYVAARAEGGHEAAVWVLKPTN